MENRHSYTPWSVIVVTAANEKQAALYEKEMLFRQKRGLIPQETAILTVADPVGVRIGSGGATLNALLAAAEDLSARAGRSVLDPDVVRSSRVLIIHSGGDSRRIPQASAYGKAFSLLPIPDGHGELFAPIDLLIRDMTRVCSSVETGVFVASCDIVLHLPESDFNWPRQGVVGLAIPADASYGTRHGVYQIDPETRKVKSFFQKASIDRLRQNGAIRKDGKVLIDSGVIYFSPEAIEQLLTLLVTPPLDACTYLGIDNGARPVRLELYSDLLLCMAENANREDYLAAPSDEKNQDALIALRKLLWKTLHGIPFYAVVSDRGHFIHLGTTQEFIDFLIADSGVRTQIGVQNRAESYCGNAVRLSPKSILMNSLLENQGDVGEETVIEHSHLQGDWKIGRRVFCSGLRSFPNLRIKDGMVVQESSLRATPDPGKKVLTLFAVLDDIKKLHTGASATVAGKPWSFFLDQLGIDAEVIWPGIDESERTLWTAKLYPILADTDSPEIVLWLQDDEKPDDAILRRWIDAERVSFNDLLSMANREKDRDWRLQVDYRIKERKIREVFLERRNEYVIPLFNGCALHERWDILQTLDDIALQAPLDIAARVLASTADCLTAFAGKTGGLRSGPAQNPDWREGFTALRENRIADAVRFFAQKRVDWLNNPRTLTRAARHYEGAAQILIQKAVSAAEIRLQRADPLPIGVEVVASSPARIDLAGGWTDAPPITFEFGGAVVNMAVAIDGAHPLRVKVRRIDEPLFRFQIGDREEPVVCKTLADFSDYNHPLSPGALLKAAVLCMGILDLASKKPLKEQLAPFGGGLEIQTRCNLPMGSGLGTSSILGGVILAAIGKAMGYEYDPISLIHAVLLLEQMMTTGGGWQDQVGGLLPGIKYTHSSTTIPFQVKPEILSTTDSFVDELNQRMVLVFTGRTRLARNLLQDVVRRWYARSPEMMSLVEELCSNTDELRNAIADEDIEKIGFCVDRYWDQKKRIAAGVEPAHVREMIDSFRPHIHGATLTGAGGGGFLFLVTKERRSDRIIRDILVGQPKFRNAKVYDIRLDREGIQFNRKEGTEFDSSKFIF